ncbi:MAG: hypothetical protein DRP65_08625 [Planctomycetota bacterium]|nr:MAG: hypothetical protein DRP65_08625 [Planctomycetota bacterium]
MDSVCPHCENIVSSAKVELVDSVETFGTRWKSALFSCPHCNKVLNVSFDITSHAKHIIEQVTKNITNQ